MSSETIIPLLFFIILSALSVGIILLFKDEPDLLANESIVLRSRHHWSVWLRPLIVSIILVSIAVAVSNSVSCMAVSTYALLWFAILNWTITYCRTHLTLTDRRVILKQQTLTRGDITEFYFWQIESVNAKYSLFDRLIRRGTVRVTGAGGTSRDMRYITQPEQICRQINAYADQSSGTPTRNTTMAAPIPASVATATTKAVAKLPSPFQNTTKTSFSHYAAAVLEKQGYQVTIDGLALQILSPDQSLAIAHCYPEAPSLDELQRLVGAMSMAGVTRGCLISGESIPTNVAQAAKSLAGYSIVLIDGEMVKRKAQQLGL